MLKSVRRQGFGDWELCLVDDCSAAPHVAQILDEAARGDARIRVSTREENGGIVAASNDALAMAEGEFVVLLDHDDKLHPDALELVEKALCEDPEVDYLYTDEDKIDEAGHHSGPVLQARLVAGAVPDPDVHLPPQRPAPLAGRGGRWLPRRVRGLPGLGPDPAGDRAGAEGRPPAADPLPLADARDLGRRRRRRGEAVGLRSGDAGAPGPLRADRAAGGGRARPRAPRRLQPRAAPRAPAAGQHRDPDRRQQPRGPLRAGRARHPLRPQHRRDLDLRRFRARRRRRHLDRARDPRRAPGDRRRAAAGRPLRPAVQLLGEDQRRRGPRRGRAPADAQRRHGGDRPRLDRADGHVLRTTRGSAPSAAA